MLPNTGFPLWSITKAANLNHPEAVTLLIQIVYFHQSDSGSVVYAADNGGVVARLQVCNDR